MIHNPTMKKYNVIDETLINAPVADIFNAIIDCYNGSNNWWLPYLSSSKTTRSNSSLKNERSYKVTIHQLIPIQFIAKTEEFEANRKIRLSYPKGAFKGEGIWLFESVGEKTKVSFRWQTSPTGFFMKSVSQFFPLNKAHSAVMQKGFKNLKRMLEK